MSTCTRSQELSTVRRARNRGAILQVPCGFGLLAVRLTLERLNVIADTCRRHVEAARRAQERPAFDHSYERRETGETVDCRTPIIPFFWKVIPIPSGLSHQAGYCILSSTVQQRP